MSLWGKRQTIGEIKLTSVPETDLELELNWLDPDYVKKNEQKKAAALQVEPNSDTPPLKPSQKFFLEPAKVKPADIVTFYEENASWERQSQARFCVMVVLLVALSIVFLCSILRQDEVYDWDVLAIAVVSLLFSISTRIRNSKRLWHALQIFTTLVIMADLGLTISVVFFHPNHPSRQNGLTSENTANRIRRVFRVPLLTFTFIPIFAASGLPNKLVILNGAIQMIACCTDNYMFLLYLFPGRHLELFPITILLGLVGIITLYTVHDHDKHKKAAFLHRVLAEQSNLGKMCEQEAAGTHQRRIVDYLYTAVSAPLEEAQGRIQQAQSESQPDFQKIISFAGLQIRAAMDVLRDAVSVTKLEAGAFGFHHSAFRFADMINAVLDLANKDVPRKSQVTVDDKLKNIVVRADPNELTSALATSMLICSQASDPGQQVKISVTSEKWTEQSPLSSPTVLIKFVIEFRSSSITDPSALLRPWHDAKGANAGLKLVVFKGVVEKGHRGKLIATKVGDLVQLCSEIEFPLCSQADLDPPTPARHARVDVQSAP
eukprot:c3043_g1_i1.p1 GENE.c3043_g1_i1~~c3043_g1_i1.p1  ORF type:complete len:555 (+),score=89.41 c3043_g1_i1:28-1665(+)